jgi:hypothetical protein
LSAYRYPLRQPEVAGQPFFACTVLSLNSVRVQPNCSINTVD